MNHNDHLKGYPKAKRLFRTLGPILAVIGLLFIIIAAIDFFSAFGTFEQPNQFYLFFIGGPLLFVGLAMSSWGYMGDIARYGAAETAPVAKDVTNYMIEGTKDSVTDLVSGIASEIHGNKGPARVTCSCGEVNNPGAKFCDNCGKPLVKTCPQCQADNDPDARFCSECGVKLN